jgi:NMD protein affecting ribosome stability and mRNA decay
MNTTFNDPDETTCPEPRCPRCGKSEDAPNNYDLCENCLERWDA